MLEIPEFKEIWKRDKDKLKSLATKQILYIYYYIDYSSPYSNYAIETKGDVILSDIFKDEDSDFSNDELIGSALIKYNELQQTPGISLVNTYKNKLYDIERYIRDAQVTDDNAKLIIDLMSKIPALMESLSKAEDILKSKRKSDENIRGAKEKKMFEDD